MFLVLSISWVAVSTVFSSSDYPIQPIEPTFYAQGTGNWCGPDSLQSAIQWVNQRPFGIPVSTTVPIIPKATLWAYMRDYTCSEIGGGVDSALPGTVGDGAGQVRRMNIAYDYGVDPHAMAWTMWKNAPTGYFYHYWIYDPNFVYQSTVSLLYKLENYHEPVIVAAVNGYHWILVTGYKADHAANSYDGPGTIYQIRIADPATGQINWYYYDSGDKPWISYWFTPYSSNNGSDPDPSTGWYVPPPDLWQNHLVAIERDGNGFITPDWGWSATTNSQVPSHLTNHNYIPVIMKN
jgi:hypothetical protein